MKKVVITFATVFALVLSAGMSVASPLIDNGHQTAELDGSGFYVNSEYSNSSDCDSCTDAWS